MLGTAAAAQPASSPVTVTPVLSADVNSVGQPIVFPKANGHVTVSVFEISPGAVLPVHKHPFPRMGYVLSGSLRVTDLDKGTNRTFGPGEAILESVDDWHEGSNPGAEPLKLLVIDLQEKGVDNTILRDSMR